MTENKRAVSPPLPPDPRSSSRQRPSPARSARDHVEQDRYSQASTSSLPSGARSRESSNAQPVIHQPAPQPIREAVDKAFDQSIDHSPATSQLDPTLIAQITEAVVKNIQNANLNLSQQQTQQPVFSASPPVASDYISQSPLASDASLPSRYTPPSPQRNRIKPRDSLHSFDSGGFSSGDEPLTQPQNVHIEEVEDDAYAESSQYDSKRSSRYSSSFDSTAATSTKSKKQSPPASTTVPESVGNDWTALEKAWQPLFDKNDKPTPRFGQFLRGIALHLINDYEPKASIVVTPAKMLRFLEDTRVENELYPWRIIFGGSTSCASISTIYRRLLVQHHLVQTTLYEPPNLPGLTPHGFETFMTSLMQAHPDKEFERLSKAAIHIPISNADSPKERFPKELSRRLLPTKANSQVEQRLIASMAHEPGIRLRSSTSMPPPPPPPTTAAPPTQGPLPERQRMPYARAPHSNAFDDEDLSTSAAPIERERKPYVAREGGGKAHPDQEYGQSRSQNEHFMPRPPSRQNSTSTSFAPSGNSPPEQRGSGRARLDTGPGSQPPLSYNMQSGGRSGRRSPPLTTSYSRSDVGSDPSQYHHMSEPNISEARYNARRSTVANPANSMDQDPRGTPIPPRQDQRSSAYGSSYSSNGGQQAPNSFGSSLPQQRRYSNVANNLDDRRKSAYLGSDTGAPEGWNAYQNYGPPRQPQGYPSSVGPNGGPGISH